MEPFHRLRRALEPVISRVMHFYWRFARAATLGARAVVIDGAGRIFLIKHSYVDGWHLPGGGVEAGTGATAVSTGGTAVLSTGAAVVSVAAGGAV